MQKEIKHFGGDANRVTIMGHSSGGDTVNLVSIAIQSAFIPSIKFSDQRRMLDVIRFSF